MATIFFTGFPGFLGAELLPRVLRRAEGAEAVCLVQPKFADLARATVAKASLEYVPFLERLTGIPAEVLDYWVHPTYYLTDNVRRDLAGTEIEVPAFASYASRLVEFVRAHPDIRSEAMA